MTGRLLTARELADLLGMQTWTLLDWVRQGKAPPSFRMPSNQLRFKTEDVEQWLEERRVGAPKQPALRAVACDNGAQEKSGPAALRTPGPMTHQEDRS